MAPKRSRKKKLARTLTRSTRKVVRETVRVAVVEGDAQESTQEERNGDQVEDLMDVLTKERVRIIPVEEKAQEDEEEVEDVQVSLEVPNRDVPVHQGTTREEHEEERAKERGDKKDQRNGVSQEEEEPSTQEAEREPFNKKKEEKNERTSQVGKGNGRKRKRRGKAMEVGREGYKRYVFKVLKQVHPELRISSMAMRVINNFMNDIFERLADEAAKLSRYTDRMTLSSREIQDTVKLVLPGELGKHATAEGSKAITNYASYDEANKSKS